MSVDHPSSSTPSPERIKLLLVIPTLDRSGAEKQFATLAAALPQDEFEVRVVALTRGGPYAEVIERAGLPITVLNKRFRIDPLALWKLRRIVREFQPDLVHGWLFAANSAVRLVTPRGGAKIVISERCVDSWKAGWQLKLDRMLIGKTDRLLANSRAVADFYTRLGHAPERITVIPNAVTPPERPADPQALRAEFDLPADAKLVGFVGRLARQKRGRDLVWAFQLLRQLTDNVYFLIVGDGPERERMEKLAHEFGVDPLVRFLGHRHDAGSLMHLLDVFWLMSDFEGQSNSLMEAMSIGLPVVVSDILPNRELVIDGETGFVVQPGDCVGLAQFTDRLLADDDLRSCLGTAGKDRMQSEFTTTTMIQKHLDVYRSLSAP